MENLVVVQNNELYTDTFIIAEGTGNEHNSVKRLVAVYADHFMTFGNTAILNRSNGEAPSILNRTNGKVSILNRTLETSGGKQTFTYYQLNEPQALFLMTLLRNNEIVVAFKLELVRQFYQMRMALLKPPPPELDERVAALERCIDVLVSKLTAPLPERQRVPLMLPVAKCVERIKQERPGTRISVSGIKGLVYYGMVPSVNSGRNTYVNYDALVEYINSDPPPIKEQREQREQYGVIRRATI